MKFKSQIANCLKIQPIEENISENFVNIKIVETNICSATHPRDRYIENTVNIRMMYINNGWKIDKYEIIND